MVQRKVANKLTLQLDHIKTKNQLLPLKSSSLHHQTELKTKKMKKSGSTKLDSPRSPKSTRHVKKQPAKPPPPPPPELVAALAPPAGVAPPPHKPPPNYMKPTSSSHARIHVSTQTSSIFSRKSSKLVSSGKNKATKTTSLKTMRTLTKNPSFKPTRVRKFSKAVLCDVKRSTCSSTLKDCKFPSYLELNHGGTESDGKSAIKVCPYTYCSLNGHLHRPALPPLKRFLSERRIMVKNQRSIKIPLKHIEDNMNEKLFNKDDLKGSEEESNDFFVEIYSKKKEDHEEQNVEILNPDASICCDDDDNRESVDQNGDFDSMDISKSYEASDMVSLPSSIQENYEASDMEWDILSHKSLYLDDDYEYPPENEVENHVIRDEMILNSDNKGGCCNEFMADEISQQSFDEESFNSDPFSSNDSESTGSYNYLDSLINEFSFEENIQNQDQFDKGCNKSENINISSPFVSEESEESYLNGAKSKCKKPIEDCDELGHNFNPRAPNFLPQDPDPDSQKVDLRHQELDEKKNAEEWMVDYALRQAVTKLGPARKRKVELLVEAFEKVMPITKCELHMRHSSGFDHARTVQACN